MLDFLVLLAKLSIPGTSGTEPPDATLTPACQSGKEAFSAHKPREQPWGRLVPVWKWWVGRVGHCPIACSPALDRAALTPRSQCRGQSFPQLQMFMSLFLTRDWEQQNERGTNRNFEACSVYTDGLCAAVIPSAARLRLCYVAFAERVRRTTSSRIHLECVTLHSNAGRAFRFPNGSSWKLSWPTYTNTPTQSQHRSQFFLTASLLTQLVVKCLLSSDWFDWFGGMIVGNCPHRNYRN